MSGVSYTTSDAIGANGAKIEWVDAKGKTHQISLLTLEKQSAYERWLEKESIKAIRNVKDVLGEDEYTAALSVALDNITSGRYVFGGEYAQESLTTFKGMCAMISILFSITNEQAMELVKENKEIGKIIENIIVRSFPVPEGNGEEKVSEK